MNGINFYWQDIGSRSKGILLTSSYKGYGRKQTNMGVDEKGGTEDR